MSSSDVDLL